MKVRLSAAIVTCAVCVSCGGGRYDVALDHAMSRTRDDVILHSANGHGADGEIMVDHLARVLLPTQAVEPEGFPYYVYVLVDDEQRDSFREAVAPTLLQLFEELTRCDDCEPQDTMLLVLPVQGDQLQARAGLTATQLGFLYDADRTASLSPTLDAFHARLGTTRAGLALLVTDEPILDGSFQPDDICEYIALEGRPASAVQRAFDELRRQLMRPTWWQLRGEDFRTFILRVTEALQG